MTFGHPETPRGAVQKPHPASRDGFFILFA